MGYADESKLLAEVPTPGKRVPSVPSLARIDKLLTNSSNDRWIFSYGAGNNTVETQCFKLIYRIIFRLGIALLLISTLFLYYTLTLLYYYLVMPKLSEHQ